jgi:hypothetical protein
MEHLTLAHKVQEGGIPYLETYIQKVLDSHAAELSELNS